jgi:FkbH-like protein
MADDTAMNWVSEALRELGNGAGIGTVSLPLQGEVEMLAGKACLPQGGLEQALRLFEQAAEHLDGSSRQRELAGNVLQLARAWGKRADGDDRAAHVEKALRLAVSLDDAQALPALAQHLQRQGHLAEAIAVWRDAIRVSPGDAGHYSHLARLYERSDQPHRAMETYLELVAAAPTARNYLVVAQRFDELAASTSAMPGEPVKIALLGNATLDHMQSYMKVACYQAGFQPEIYQCGFDQYTQDILNPGSELYRFGPDVMVLAVHASRLFPHIHQYPFALSVEDRRAEMDAGLDGLRNLLDNLTERTSALVLVHNMVAPQYPALGVLDWRDNLGQTEMFGQINARLAELVRSRYKNVYVVDEDRAQARAGKVEATDVRLWLTARLPWGETTLSTLSREYMRYIFPYKARGRKCIVLDLDNMLWGGVIGEDGLGGIQIGADAPGNAYLALQRELERLWKRGILLAICSKNNEEDVLPVFEQHVGMLLKRSHFAAQRINWRSKSENIREIAAELNIGLDSLVFLDDNPVERARVRAELPDVLTPELPTDPAYYRRALAELTVFDSLTLTEEDRRRNTLYAEQKARREFEASHTTASGSLTAYLAALEMVVTIEPLSEQTLPRIAQLTNKTNQFNLTTRRYSESAITALMASGSQTYSARVADRFGDNGLVGLAILRPEDGKAWEIDTLLLSCRVMGRGVETALLAFLAERVRDSGGERLQGWYLPTPKNSPVKDCFKQHGFSLVESRPDGSERWELDLATGEILVPEWLRVRVPATV